MRFSRQQHQSFKTSLGPLEAKAPRDCMDHTLPGLALAAEFNPCLQLAQDQPAVIQGIWGNLGLGEFASQDYEGQPCVLSHDPSLHL